jgi:hypothetical protein
MFLKNKRVGEKMNKWGLTDKQVACTIVL